MAGSCRRSTGGFAVLTAPTMLTLSFLLAMALCERQELHMDIRVIHPRLAAQLATTFGVGARVGSLVAGATAVLIALRSKSWPSDLAVLINGVTALLGLLSLIIVE